MDKFFGTIKVMKHINGMREKVCKLRAMGKTYSEIKKALRVDISKSTLSYWCRKVELPIWYKDKLKKLNSINSERGRKLAWLANKIKRERFLSNLMKNSEQLVSKVKDDKDVLKTLLSILYLGEGAKWRSHRGLQLGSSDPNIILLYIKLLNKCYRIPTRNLKCWISYRADQNINSLKNYWSKITGVPLENFFKSSPDPRTIGKPTLKKDYKGVCVISCAGTHIQLELEAIPGIILKGL